MSKLRIQQKQTKFSLPLPHKIWINGQFVGIMKDEEVTLALPAGHFEVTIQSMVPILSASTIVKTSEEATTVLSFHDREKWWDYLFLIDLVCWIAEFFFTLPHPWNIVYKVFTNGYFILWLLYEWSIRKKYFALESFQIIEKSKTGAIEE